MTGPGASSMRLAFAMIVAVACALGAPAFGAGYSLSGDARWIVLASRQTLDEAIGVARAYTWRFRSVRVMQSTNGWFAIVAGPERIADMRAYKDTLVRAGGVPKDLIFSTGDSYIAEAWRSGGAAAQAEATYDGERPVTFRSGSVSVTIASAPSKDGSGRVPVATGRQGGQIAFAMRLDESERERPPAAASVIRLDASSPEPQIVFTAHWGGAHCCTVTKVATATADGRWRVVTGKTLDGDGYAFEDIDGDGAHELISLDNSFLYAFASYAESSAPMQISTLVGDRLVERTRDPRYQRYLRQQVYRLEHFASLYPAQWRSNGFLAGWVGAKALVGEFDEAWARMLTLYDRTSDWGLTECLVERTNGLCPKGQERTLTFPVALRKHLEQGGYVTKGAAAPPPEAVAVVRPSPADRVAPQAEERRSSSGTGFFVSQDGHILTNAHVVKECRSIEVTADGGEPVPARITARDAINDLALLKAEVKAVKVATFRNSMRLGEAVAVFGYPLTNVLSRNGNFTLGNVTALAGLGDDSRHLQISAPVQAGNSGGPLLDHHGQVAGVVVAKLNAIRMAVASGDLPQNVNFAIKASVASSFLESNGITPTSGHAAAAPMNPADLADLAKAQSVFIACR